MRRTSWVAPILLIALGGLFLARNLHPELPLLDYVARYWPFLLIGWGVLRLVEILHWASNSQPLPRRGISGGEWIVIIFLCIFGFSVHTVRQFSPWWSRNGIGMGGIEMFGESFDYPMSGEKACSKTPRVTIEAFRGNARITGADVDSVKVAGHETIRSLDRNAADRAHQNSPLELSGDGNQIVIRTHQDRIGGNLRIASDMEITVPKGSTIEAHGRSGDFDVTDIGGSVDITSDNAGVRLQNIGGEARIDLRRSDAVHAMNVKGAFDLKGRGSEIDLQNIEGPVTVAGIYTGELQFRNLASPLHFNGPMGTDLNIEKIPGQVRMALGDFTASNLVGPIHFSARSRDVQISDFTNALELSVGRGDIELRPGRLPLGRMDVHTHSGDVTLSLPPAAKFDLTATTERGDITNDYGDPLKLQSHGSGATLRGSEDAGPAVILETDRGRVIVRKSAPDDKPLTPRDSRNPPELPATSTPLRRVEQ